MPISDYNSNPDLNTSQLGMATGNNALNVGNVDNAIRKLMADLAVWYATAQPLIAQVSSKQGASLILSALVGAGAAADRIAVYTGSDAATLATLTTFARTLLDDADATAACNTLGAIRVAALDLSPFGYAKFQVGSAPLYFFIQWGSLACGVGNTTVTYPVAFSTFSRPVISGGSAGSSQNNGPYVVSASTASFVAHSDVSTTGFWVAVGS